MNRRELREQTFLFLFRIDFHAEEEMEEQMELFLKSEKLTEKEDEDRLKIKKRALDAFHKIPELDEKIEAVAQGWKKNRMGKVELTILRLALYEMGYDEEVPTNVAINEAVELSKKFGGDESPSFVNGILAKLV